MGVKTVIQLLYRTACNARYVVLLTQATHDTTTTATATTRAQSRVWLVKTANNEESYVSYLCFLASGVTRGLPTSCPPKSHQRELPRSLTPSHHLLSLRTVPGPRLALKTSPDKNRALSSGWRQWRRQRSATLSFAVRSSHLLRSVR